MDTELEPPPGYGPETAPLVSGSPRERPASQGTLPPASTMSSGLDFASKSLMAPQTSQDVAPMLTTTQGAPVDAVVAQSPAPPAVPPPDTPSAPGSGDTPPPFIALDADQWAYVNRWSFGPTIGWIYFSVNGAFKWGCLYFMGPALIGSMAVFLPPIVAPLVYPVEMIVWLGIILYAAKQGRRIAWEAKPWPSFEAFQDSQRKWSRAALVLYGLLLVTIGIVAIGFSRSGSATSPAGTGTTVRNRLENARDIQRIASVDAVASAVERCFANSATRRYTHCDSVSELVADGYLSGPVGAVVIASQQDTGQILVYAQLKTNAYHCQFGSGSKRYMVYSTTWGKDAVHCGESAPSFADLR